MTTDEILIFIAEFRNHLWASAIAARLLDEPAEDVTAQQINASDIDTLLRMLVQKLESNFDCNIDVEYVNTQAQYLAKRI